MKAPIGEKYCHYDPMVSTVWWGTSPAGQPIESLDGGKTWSPYTPRPGETVPLFPSIETVVVSWERKDD